MICVAVPAPFIPEPEPEVEEPKAWEKITDKLKLKVIESAQKALKTLKSVLPNFDIVIHENEGSYNAAMIERNGKPSEAGNFSIDNEGSYSGRIDINLERANARTVAHEVAHGIMLKVFGDTPALFKNFRDRISTVLKESANQKLIEFAFDNSFVGSIKLNKFFTMEIFHLFKGIKCFGTI